MNVTLRIRNFDSGSGEMFVHQIIQVTLETTWPIAHFRAPDDQFEIDGVSAEFLEEHCRRRLTQRRRMFARGRDESIAHFLRIGAVSHTNRNVKSHPWIAVGP